MRRGQGLRKMNELGLALAFDLLILNNYLKKREDDLITYKRDLQGVRWTSFHFQDMTD